jgi:hypothetical protein
MCLFQELCQWWIKIMCFIHNGTGLSAHISLYSLKMSCYGRPKQINNTVQQVGIDSLWVEHVNIWRRASLCLFVFIYLHNFLESLKVDLKEMMYTQILHLFLCYLMIPLVTQIIWHEIVNDEFEWT